MSDLKPCPFCGGASRIESNRDWHRLYADHDENCFLDADEADIMYPAKPEYLTMIYEVWNRRTQPEATAPAQDLSAAILEQEPADGQGWEYDLGFKHGIERAAAIAASANA